VNNLWDAPVIIDGKEYLFDDEVPTPVKQMEVQTQPGEDGQEFSERIENFALGWGHSKQLERNTYDYGFPAVLNRRLSFLPGCVVFEYTPATVPIGPATFCEYWDGVEANRRLIIVTPRHIYEIDGDGTVVTVDMGANFTTTRAMTYGVLFRNASTAVPRMYVARQSAVATDYFVTRGTGGVWTLTTSNLRADAIASGKDQTGANVLWIVDPDTKGGELRQCVADADPELAGSYGLTSYPIGEISVRTNVLLQQAKRMLAARPDGIFSFDNVARTVPITPGLEALLDSRNGFMASDFNGMVVVPTIGGLLWVDGLEWGYCGPVSSNTDARSLRDVREMAFAGAGEYAYCATWDGTDSYIYSGTVRSERNTGSGAGPFIWHGPIAVLENVQVTDLRASTVFGKRLWIGLTDGFAALNLNDDFSPISNMDAGYVYLPEGVLDRAGPQVIKEIHNVELIAPVSKPFDVNNTWAAEFDFGSGYESPGSATSGSYSKEEFVGEKFARRPLMRLAYTSNGPAELEAVIVNGIERPEVRWHYVLNLKATETQRKPGGARTWRHPETVEEDLKALRESGWVGLVKFGQTEINAKVVSVRPATHPEGRHTEPTRFFEVELSERP
jgi:hypothetical protein